MLIFIEIVKKLCVNCANRQYKLIFLYPTNISVSVSNVLIVKCCKAEWYKLHFLKISKTDFQDALE